MYSKYILGLVMVLCLYMKNAHSDKSYTQLKQVSTPTSVKVKDGDEATDTTTTVNNAPMQLCADAHGAGVQCDDSDLTDSRPVSSWLENKDVDKDEVRKKIETAAGLDDAEKLELFSNFDKTKKGFLTKIDIAAFLERTSGITHVTKLEANLFLSFVDSDKDGKVSVEEYKHVLINHKNQLLRTTFSYYQSESGDCIYEEDLELLSDDVVYEFMILDSNGDQCLSFDEFQKVFVIFGVASVGGDRQVISTNSIHKEAVADYSLEEGVQAEEEDYSESTLSDVKSAMLLWSTIDENQDGFVSKKELANDLATHASAKTIATPLFMMLDSNDDGKVSKRELELFFLDPPTDNEQIVDWLKTFSLFGDNEIDEFTESETVVNDKLNMQIASLEDEVEQSLILAIKAFNIFDKNKNEIIEWDELKFAMEMSRKFTFELTVNITLNDFDSDKNGVITYGEFTITAADYFRTNKDGIELNNEYVEIVDESGNIDHLESIKNNATLMMAFIFLQIDTNGDALISSKELRDYLEPQVYFLTDEELQQQFDSLDDDNNGFIALSADKLNAINRVLDHKFYPMINNEYIIDFETFRNIMHSVHTGTVTESEVSSRLKVLDLDKDNAISLVEFKLLEMADDDDFINWIDGILTEKYLDKDEEFIDAYEFFDEDTDGFISNEELGYALYKLTNKKLSPDEVQERLLILDLNGDEKISMTEFEILLWKGI